MHVIYHWLRGFFKRKRRLSPEEIARKLPSGALTVLHREAAFLRAQHITVADLKHDEEPGMPRPADPAVESSLISRVPPSPAAD